MGVVADVARADMADRFPELGEAIGSGSARPDNVDVLARMCDRMTEAEIDVLIQSDNLIADAASRLRTDSFRRKIHRLRDRIRATTVRPLPSRRPRRPRPPPGPAGTTRPTA